MAQDLKAKAILFIDLLNKKDFGKADEYLDPNMVQYLHGKEPVVGAEACVARFKALLTQMAPNFHAEVVDAIAEGNKVWLFMKIIGFPGELSRESVDIMEFSEEGKLIRTKDVQRTLEAN